MKRPHLFGLSSTAAALSVVAIATVATPATAGTPGCRTTMSGGIVGNEVINSSGDVFAEAALTTQRVTIDMVTVNYFGQKRYRLASSVRLATVHGSTRTTFSGGTGYFVSEQSLRMTAAFASCARTLQS